MYMNARFLVQGVIVGCDKDYRRVDDCLCVTSDNNNKHSINTFIIERSFSLYPNLVVQKYLFFCDCDVC